MTEFAKKSKTETRAKNWDRSPIKLSEIKRADSPNITINGKVIDLKTLPNLGSPAFSRSPEDSPKSSNSSPKDRSLISSTPVGTSKQFRDVTPISESQTPRSVKATPIKLYTPKKSNIQNQNFTVKKSIFIESPYVSTLIKNQRKYILTSPQINLEKLPITVITKKGDLPLPKSKTLSSHRSESESSDDEPELYIPIGTPAFRKEKDPSVEEVIKSEEEWIAIVEDFNLFRKKFPDLDIQIPKREDNLVLIKGRRDVYRKKIAIKEKVKEWQLYIIVGSMALELLSMFLGVDAEEFTESQYKILNVYEKDLEKMCQNNYGGVLEGYSPEYKILLTMGGYYLLLIVVKFMLSKMPERLPKESLKETIFYYARGNFGDNKEGGPTETNPITRFLSDISGYMPILQTFLKTDHTAEPVQEPIFDD